MGRDRNYPVIDRGRTGLRIRELMETYGLTVEDVRAYLGLGTVQSIYHWLNGRSLPSTDNLYALAALFDVPVDGILCGSRDVAMTPAQEAQQRRIAYYCRKLLQVA